jgi:hypothetical protein
MAARGLAYALAYQRWKTPLAASHTGWEALGFDLKMAEAV